MHMVRCFPALLISMIVFAVRSDCVGADTGTSQYNIRPSQGLRPCDIYAGARTPCVAAHSTVRALYASYNGPLYQVQRSSDNATQDIGLLSAGGYANAAAQDNFCAGTSCYFTKIYDQSSQHNNLVPSVGGWIGSVSPVDATLLPINIAGHKAYGVYIHGGQSFGPGQGFSDRNATGTAGSSHPKAACDSSCAEGIYMVTSSNVTGGGCCFDYGNAARTPSDDGDGTMHAIYWGNGCWITPCAPGKGPWISYDLENGWFYSDYGIDTNKRDTGVNYTFVTTMSSTDGTTTINRKTANAQSGGLTTWFSGLLPQVGAWQGPGSPCSNVLYPAASRGWDYTRHRRRQLRWQLWLLLRRRDDDRAAQ
jgi:non-reducing end alpha-L-arabinofuranosidase